MSEESRPAGPKFVTEGMNPSPEQLPAESKSTPEQDTVAERPGFVIERRTVGETHYTFILLEHNKHMAKAMRQALWHCNYIGIEQPGHNDGKPRRDQSTTFQTDQEITNSVQELAKKPRTKAFYIDMHQDDLSSYLFLQHPV